MNSYEILYIIDNSVDETKRDALISQYEEMVKADGGVVEKTDKWGDKKYNYSINFKDEVNVRDERAVRHLQQFGDGRF